MRIKNTAVLAVAFLLVGTFAIAGPPARADDAPLQGNWKLVVLFPAVEAEFAIFNVNEKDAKTTATVVDAQQDKLKSFDP